MVYGAEKRAIKFNMNDRNMNAYSFVHLFSKETRTMK